MLGARAGVESREPEAPGLAGGMRGLLGLAVISVVALAVVLAFFAHPSGDDFCNAVDARELGLWESVHSYYAGWGGRWSSQIVAVGFPALFEMRRWYPLALLVNLASIPVAFRFLLVSVFPLRGRARHAWGVSLAFLALYWTGMPHPGQSVYWLEGAWIYSFNLSLSMLLVGALLRLPARLGEGRRALAALGAALAALVIAAFHELFALVLAAVLAAGAVVALRWRDARHPVWTAAALGALLGFASVLLSPGNAVRQETLNPGSRSLLGAVAGAALTWIRVLDTPSRYAIGFHSPLGWVLDPRLLAASLLFVALPSFRSWRPAWLEREPELWRLGIPLLSLGLLTGSFLAGGWARGSTLPLRALNALYLVFLLGWFLTLFVHTRPPGWQAGSGRGLRVLQASCAALLSLGLVFSPNFRIGLRDLVRGRAAAFDRAMTVRYEQARAARGRGDEVLVLDAVEPWPSSYFRNDVDDLLPALQRCAARYFEVASVRIAAPDGGDHPARTE